MKEYRIVKRYYRDITEHHKVNSYYIVQYLGINRLKSIFYCKKYLGRKDYFCDYVYEFNSPKEAKIFIENLKTPVHADEVI